MKKLAAVRGGLKDSQRSQFERVKILQDPPWAELFIDEELFTLAPNPGARRVHDGVLHSVGAMAPVRGRHFFEGRAQVVPLHDGAKVRDLLALALGRFGAAPSQDDPFVVVLTSDKAELEQVSEVCVCICLRTGARLCWLTPAGGVVPT